jgi:hypothetical protein
MKLIDKLLLFLMLTLLPVGLGISYLLVRNTDKSNNSIVAGAMDEKKLESVLQEIATKQTAPNPATPPAFNIFEVSLATESGTFSLKAKAPSSKMAVLVTSTVFPPLNASPSATPNKKITDQPKFGQVETISLMPKTDSAFEFDYDLGKLREGFIEVRLEQDKSVTTMRFDLAKKIQVQ